MNRNLVWKFGLVVILVVMCGLSIWPPDKKLKRGIDLAGGTSLLYQIDTSGMEDVERAGVAEKMIRILRKRTDPDNKRNLIWRSHGVDRIEIQMPLATKESRDLRKVYQEKLLELKQFNLNLSRVRQLLVQPEGVSRQEYLQQRTEDMKSLAGASTGRLELLEALVGTHDGLEVARGQLVETLKRQEQLRKQSEEKGLSEDLFQDVFNQWAELDEVRREEELKKISGGDAQSLEILRESVDVRQKLQEYRGSVDSLQEQTDQAWANIEMANIDLERLVQFLSARKGDRLKEINRVKESHPMLVGVIDDLVATYDIYDKVSGRLEDPEDLKRLLKGAGVLEFRILPIHGGSALSETEIRTYIENLSKSGPKRASTEEYVWLGIKNPEEFNVRGFIAGEFASDVYVLASNLPGEALAHETGPDAWSLASARQGSDDIGRPAVNFAINEVGKKRFWDLTKDNISRPLCIVLDDEAISAPNIKTAIPGAGEITGQFSLTEVMDLVDMLNAGSLPARLGDQPISVNTIGPTIGRDNLQDGLRAGKYGLILVAIFMLGYYLIAGALADVALFLNLLLIVGVMAFTRSTFTMPGIAGLILTIGMAVDANVLIFERIREEQMRGSSLRMAIKNGYDRAFRTIFDANLTTFIVAAILYVFASEEVKGFALTLMIGLASSMFTALFVTRLVFDFLTNTRILKKNLVMVQLIRKPSVNWMGLRPIFWTISILLVIGGWVSFFSRGAENPKYSIEFTGGTSVHVVLTENGAAELLSSAEQDEGIALREKVEQRIQQVGRETGNPLIEAARVQRIGPAERREFEIVTTETNRMEITLDLGLSMEKTASDLQAEIGKAAAEMGDRRLRESQVSGLGNPGQFLITTQQTNVNQIHQLLGQLFPKETYPEVRYTLETREMVSEAIFQALSGRLDVLTNLEPSLVEAKPITPELISQKTYLAEYKGGLFLKYDFGVGKTDTFARVEKRLNDSRFRAGMDQYGYNPFEKFAPGNKQVEDNSLLKGIEIVVTSDMLYEGTQTESWTRFVENETNRYLDVFRWETSLPRVTQIDPSVGQKSKTDAMIATVISLLAIIIYIWIRFGTVRFGLAAVVALVHDVSIALGLVAASAWLAKTPVGEFLLIRDFKIDLPMIAGFLTVIGYSLNDTIVVFDRIRENRGKKPVLTAGIITDSINQTLSRTLLTSFTTMVVLVVMYIWGGQGLRSFNFVLIIGVIVGTYSSIGIASPLLCGAQETSQGKTKTTKTKV